MPIAATLAIAAACSWASPGSDRFTGDPVAAVDRYKDIPVETRAKLKERMASRKYDEVVEIRKDRLGDGKTYGPEIRDMHWGANKMCAGVADRSKWSDKAMERGLVYCADGHCLLLPTVCGNLSRITKLEQKTVIPPEVLFPKRDEWVETPTLPEPPKQSDQRVHRVPEPSSLLLVLAAICSLVFIKRYR